MHYTDVASIVFPVWAPAVLIALLNTSCNFAQSTFLAHKN
jgi:hypothetical protein